MGWWYTAYCRLYQGIFRIVSPLLPWREPELYEGPASIQQLPELLEARRIRRVLLVTDKGIVQAGIVQKIIGILEEAEILPIIFDETVPNPTIENIETALRRYITEGCQALIALGGGSVIDCAKGVGARLARPNKQIPQLRGLLKIRKKLPFFVAIPTTAGTGSEATIAAVITNAETHEKFTILDHSLIPHGAILDPLLTLGLPPSITATTGVDALTHAVEAFIGHSNTRETEAAAIEATRLIHEHLLKVYRNGQDVEGRERLLRASYLAGKAFTRAYVGYVHAIAHTLGGMYGVAHGLANAVILPYVLEYFGKAAENRLALLAQKAGIVAPSLPPDEGARQFIQYIRKLNKEMNIPEHLPQIQEEHIPLLVQRALAEANPLYPVPRIFNADDMTYLYRVIQGTVTP